VRPSREAVLLEHAAAPMTHAVLTYLREGLCTDAFSIKYQRSILAVIHGFSMNFAI
jgi:hypothetical protein